MNTTKRDVQDEKKYYIQNMDNKNTQVSLTKKRKENFLPIHILIVFSFEIREQKSKLVEIFFN